MTEFLVLVVSICCWDLLVAKMSVYLEGIGSLQLVENIVDWHQENGRSLKEVAIHEVVSKTSQSTD